MAAHHIWDVEEQFKSGNFDWVTVINSKEIEDMIKKILNSLFGKKYSIDKAREEMVKEFHRNPMTFNNSNYRPTSFSLKIDSFMMGLGEWRNNHRRY